MPVDVVRVKDLFLAVLEMAKQKLLRIIQEQVFHKIYVCPLFSNEVQENGEIHGA